MSAGPLIVGVLLVRVLLAAGTAGAGKPSEPKYVASGTKRLLRFAIVWLVVCPTLGWMAVAPPRTLATYVPGAIFALTALFWPIARHVLAPLGLVKPAYYVALAAWSSAEEREGMALLAASVALHRQRELDPEAASWLEDRIQRQAILRGAAIAAAALTAAARGDREGARALFQSVRTLDPRVRSRAATHTAAGWLAADAAERGAWEEAIEIGSPFADAGRVAWLLAGIGQRLLGQPGAPGRPKLLLLWLLAPSRRQTFAIVERALSVPDGAAPPADDDDARPSISEPDGDLLGSALAAHARLLSARRPVPAEIARTGRAFDAAFDDDALAAQIAERGEALGAMRAETALSRMRADVEESLFQLLKEQHIALDDAADDLGGVAFAAQRRLRDETLAVIEALSDAVRSRVNERRELSAIDEWREWSALRIAYERGVTLGGPELRYLAFTKVHSDVCALAVWLFNERKERPIANAMFRFLLDEARATGDAEGISLQTKNVACGV
jgi:hypothetical protein